MKKLLPVEYHKVLVNIRKAEARAKRHRALNQAAEEEEEEEEPAQGTGDSIEEILADSEDEDVTQVVFQRGPWDTRNSHQQRTNGSV